MAVSFSGLSRAESQAVLTFFLNHLGQEVKLTDWEGKAWVGVVMTPEAPVVNDSRGRYSISFEFEGEVCV
jgi:hypothetical protein